MVVRCALIVAMAEDRIIGRDGGLPWRLSADLKQFKALTMGKPIIMGRKTYESIGKPLPGRANIVVSGNPDFAAEGVIPVGSVTDALSRAEAIATRDGVDEVMVIGGAAIYAATLPHADRIYLTEVHAAIDGDTRFPEFDRGSWREVDRTNCPASGDAPAFSFVLLERPDG